MLKSTIMHFIIIGLFSSVMLGSSTTISELKSPDTNTVDFTFNSVNKTSSSYSTGTIVDKVSYELNSLQKLFPRLFKVSSCEKDSYNTLYCPDALVKAGEYWGYDQSEVIAKKQTVIDFEQGTYQELTSTVRDFMDGFASTYNSTVIDYQSGSGTANVGTVIDYQNGSSSIGTGSVMDFTSKVNSTTNNKSCETLPNQYFCVQGIGCLYYSQCKIQPQDNPGQDTGQGWIDLRDKSATAPRSQTMLNYYASTYTGAMTNSTHIGVVWQNGLFRTTNTGQTEDKWIDFYNTSLNQSQLSKHIRVDFINGKIYPWHTTQSYISSSKPTYTRTQSEHYIDLGLSTTTTLACPSGYTDNGTNCQKLVSYDFYQYTCPATYSPINSGFTSYTKTDPNTSAENWNTLDDTINSATPPTGNCQKTITYSYYKYNCPSGYTVNDGGLTSACPRTDPNNTINNESTLSQACNNSTPPTGNCTKIIPYTFYSYECSSGYTAIDKGLATCTKSDSSTSTDTSSTLDDPCNSIIPPKENCYKDISYKHYTYGCSPGYITDNYGLSIIEEANYEY